MIRVLHYGLGPIGSIIARQIADRSSFLIVGGIDIDERKVGRDVGEVAGVGGNIGAKVWSDAAAALSSTRPDVVVLCTSSSLERVLPQINLILDAKSSVVSTTEELVYPTAGNRELIQQLDDNAKRAGSSVLGTGVNPGFAMDTLPIILTAACERVDSVEVRRVQDASIRRLPFQQKIGAGLTVNQFETDVSRGRVRHVGLEESVQMIADALGWNLDKITDTIRPKIAEATISSRDMSICTGFVSGIIQDGVGYLNGRPVIKLHMEAYIGSPETYDAIIVDGSPKVHLKIDGGIHGDIATGAMVVNAIPNLLRAKPGYHTMRDLALPSYFGGETDTEAFVDSKASA